MCGAAALRAAGLAWGLPASDGWDEDGIAPRDFLVGVVKTYRLGDYFTYPPLHLLMLMFLTAPGWIVGLVRARSLSPPDLIAQLIQIPYMTFFALTARIVSIAMSLGTIAIVGKLTEQLAGKRAGLCAAAAATLNLSLTYYGQVSNLDGPYLFWSTLALWWWVRAIAEREPHRFPWAAVFSVAAVATKDQAYAVFLLSVPAALGIWLAADPWPRQRLRSVLVPLGTGTALGLALLLLVDGAITNPQGFMARLGFLIGPASQDHAYYRHDWTGYRHLLQDAWSYVPRYYPPIAVYLGLFGLALQLWKSRSDAARRAASVLPALAIVSVTLTFNLVALRTENRFLLPQSVFLAVYIGIAIDALAFAAHPLVRWGSRLALCLPAAVIGLFQCAALEAALLQDPRYDAERWMREHVRGGDTIETYGQNTLLPRFPENARVLRVAPAPLTGRNPLPNVSEIEQPFEAVEARAPRFIVLSAFWVGEFLIPAERNFESGRIHSKPQQQRFAETAARAYFRDLQDGRLGYRLAHESAYDSTFWPAVHMHTSTAETIRIFERVEPAPPAAMAK